LSEIDFILKDLKEMKQLEFFFTFFVVQVFSKKIQSVSKYIDKKDKMHLQKEFLK